MLAGNLPGGRGDGVPLASLIDLAAKTRIVQLFVARPDTPILIAMTSGYAFHCEYQHLLTRQKAGKQFVSIEEGESLLKITPFVSRETNLVACLSSGGRLHLFPLSELKPLAGGGRGMIAMALDGDDTLAAITISDGETLVLNGVGRGGKALQMTLDANDLAPYVGKRAKKGKPINAGLKFPGF